MTPSTASAIQNELKKQVVMFSFVVDGMTGERFQENGRGEEFVNGSMIARELKSELMLYDPEADDIHILNATTRTIYQLYANGMTADDIEEAMRKRFQLEECEEGYDLRRDVHECIEMLKEKRIIVQGR